MPASLVDGNSLLAIDVGAANTRAALFDVVEGQYRFIASGIAPSTAEAPFKDVSEGVKNAIENLQAVIGKPLLDSGRGLITPSQSNGSGVDALAVTLSAGAALKTVIVGLLKDVSLESAQRLASSTYARVVDAIALNDARKPEQKIDSLLRLQPDLIIIAGGTDGGASRSIQKMLEPIGLANFLMPEEKRPSVLFAGNQKMEAEVKNLIGPLSASIHIAPNVRPALETEDLDPAERELAHIFIEIRKRQIKGVDLLNLWSGGHILPTAYASGRMTRFLAQAGNRSVLSVDLGASAAALIAAFKGSARINVFPHYGLGENLAHLLKYTTLDEILRWSWTDLSKDALNDYLHQKSLYPSAIAATKEDFAIAQAIAKQALFLATQAARKNFPKNLPQIKPTLTPLFDSIIASGGALSSAARPGSSLSLLLDALQPVGISAVTLDPNNLLPLLGSAASRNNLLPVQALESGAFVNAGTIVAPVVSAAQNAPILRATLMYEDGSKAQVELKFGSLATLPLANGEIGKLSIQLLKGADLGYGAGRAPKEGITVLGGALGVIFDGRGRPLNLPTDAARRRELLKKWHWALGGE